MIFATYRPNLIIRPCRRHCCCCCCCWPFRSHWTGSGYTLCLRFLLLLFLPSFATATCRVHSSGSTTFCVSPGIPPSLRDTIAVDSPLSRTSRGNSFIPLHGSTQTEARRETDSQSSSLWSDLAHATRTGEGVQADPCNPARERERGTRAAFLLNEFSRWERYGPITAVRIR